MANKDKTYYTAVIGNVRVFNPTVMTPGQAKLANGKLADPRFKIEWLVSKTDQETMKEAMQGLYAEFKQVFPQGTDQEFQEALKNAYFDGDVGKPGKGTLEWQKGHLCWAASSGESKPPVVLNPEGQLLLNASELYGGCTCHLDLTCNAGQRSDGSKYLKFYINQVMLVKGGERLGGGGGGPRPDAFAKFLGQDTGAPSAPAVPGAQYL